MGLRRSDLGLALSALAAAGLIVAFLDLSERDPNEETPTTTTSVATPVASGRLVRTRSPQVPELAWSSARGAFRIQCRGPRLTGLDARITDLPDDHRYAWRIVIGDANQTAPLTRRPGMTARLVEGDGLPSAFTPVAGSATVRFTFSGRPPVLGLDVLGIDRFNSFVIATPRVTCRR